MPLHIAAHFLLHSPAASYAARAAGSSLLAGALARDLWRRIPEWIREDIGFQDLFCEGDLADENNGGGGNNDEMTSLIAVIQKLQALVTVGHKKLGSTNKRQRRRRKVAQLLSSGTNNGIAEDSTTISALEFHVALLAYVQLCNQIKHRYPEWRDDMYDRYLTDNRMDTIVNSNGNSNGNLLEELSSILPRDDCSLDTAGTTSEIAASPVTNEQISELIQILDYSIMAYETNEELLKSQLHEKGEYQLLLHQTTSIVDDKGDDNGEDETLILQQNSLVCSKVKSNRRKPPGRVGYYVALSPSENKVLIGIKGTSTLEELLTDCCGRAVRCDLENNPHYQEIDKLDNSSDIDGSISEDDILFNVSTEAVANQSMYELYDESYIDLIRGEEDPKTLSSGASSSSSSSSSSYEYFELKTIEEGHEKIEVEMIQNQSESGQQEHKESERHPSDNILLLPSRYDETRQSQTNKEFLQELSESATVSTIEDNGIEMQPHRSTKLRGAHEGILHSSQLLLQEVSPLIEEYAVSKGYDIICCGHSLGAGAASLLAILIRGKYSALVSDERDAEGAQWEKQRVRAYAFAPPPLLDRQSSLACRHYVTSVVNNSDIIPRSSLTNLDVLMTVLEAVICALTEASMNPGAESTINNPIPSSLALFRKLSEGTNGKLVIEPRELKRIQKEAIYEATLGDGRHDESYWNDEGDHNLLVPGRVLLLYEKWSENKLPANLSEENGEILERRPYNAVWTNGTVKMLKAFELGGGSQAVTDHLTVSYEEALKRCISDT